MISTIIELINKIKQVNNFALVKDLLNKYDGDDWNQYVKINAQSYNREKVYEDDFFEILIITWDVNQKASIHDHAENGCFLKILDGGELEETLYDNELNKLDKKILKKDEISYMDNKIGYHCITNCSPQFVVSIHVYSPPNHLTKFFKKN
jgi:cysteine dioxygenase